jgi:hypothetical protein
MDQRNTLAHFREDDRLREPIKIQIEDDRTGMSVETLMRAFVQNLYYTQGKDRYFATLVSILIWHLAYEISNSLIRKAFSYIFSTPKSHPAKIDFSLKTIHIKGFGYFCKKSN